MDGAKVTVRTGARLGHAAGAAGADAGRRGLAADQLPGLDGAARRSASGAGAVVEISGGDAHDRSPQRPPTLEDFGTDPFWLVAAQGRRGLRLPRGDDAVRDRASSARSSPACRAGSAPTGSARAASCRASPTASSWRSRKRSCPALADKPVYFLAPILAAIPAFLAFSVIPFGPMVSIFGDADPAAADRPAGRRAHRLRLQLARRLRHRAVRLGVRLDLPAARRAALGRADDLVRDRDGAVARRGLPLRRHDVDLGASSPPSRNDAGGFIGLLLAVPSFLDLRDRGRRRDQPGAVRPARGRERAGRRLPHRVLVAEVRAVLPRRVHQHGHRLGAGHDAVPRRLAGAVADLAIWDGANSGWWPLLWFSLKVVVALFVFIWLRGTLPRLRYDQFMRVRLEGAGPGRAGLDPVVASCAPFSVLRSEGRHVGARSLLVVGWSPLAAIGTWHAALAGGPRPPRTRTRSCRGAGRRRPRRRRAGGGSRSRRWT